MAKVELGPFVTSATGTVGTTTFRKRKGTTYLSRKPTVHHNERDYYQVAARAMQRGGELWDILGGAMPGVGQFITRNFHEIWNSFTSRPGVLGRELFLGAYVQRVVAGFLSNGIHYTLGPRRARPVMGFGADFATPRSIVLAVQAPTELPYDAISVGAFVYCMNDYLVDSAIPLLPNTVVVGEVGTVIPGQQHNVPLQIPEFIPSWKEDILCGASLFYRSGSDENFIAYSRSFSIKQRITT